MRKAQIITLSVIFFTACFACRRDEQKDLPVVLTSAASEVTANSAKVGGEITVDGSSEITARGVYWGETDNLPEAGEKLEIGKGTGEFSAFVEGLEKRTTYYFKAFATNKNGTAYGEVKSFKTTLFTYGEGLKDRDGNYYKSIIIGDQEWMASNLKVTNYRNGDPIPGVRPDDQWESLSSGGYIWYDHDSATLGDQYGALYNWHAVNDERRLCPEGWRIPKKEDWEELIEYLGGEDMAGGKMKSTRTFPDPHPRWDDPNTGSSNISGFSGFPAGYREKLGRFVHLGERGFWWSATEHQVSETMAVNAVLNSDSQSILFLFSSKNRGCSVRCIKE